MTSVWSRSTHEKYNNSNGADLGTQVGKMFEKRISIQGGDLGLGCEKKDAKYNNPSGADRGLGGGAGGNS